MIGSTISHFRVLDEIGKGGMGLVYKALDLKLDRPVALKFLSTEFTRDPQAKERFMREAKAASALQHNNICTIHEIDESDDGRLFIVMDFYEGETLKSKLAHGPLQPRDAIDVSLQIARGLVRAHGLGIVHRDLTPANIMITGDGVVKILDFGVAKLRGNTTLTRAGSSIGTAPYMSPEQIQGLDVDHRTDLWSLGTVMYEMLAGHPPFQAEHNAALAYSIVHTDPPALQKATLGTTAMLSEVVTGLLEKDRDRRIPSADEVVQRLIRVKSGTDSSRLPRTPQRKSIAVLPFTNLSPDPDNEFFTAGITDEINGSLSKLKQLRVCSRSMTQQYKGKLIDPRVVGKELGADVILEGSVRRLGQRVRLAVELTDATTGFQVWAQSFDRQIEDVFAVQDEIARTIVEALELQLTSDDRAGLLQKYMANVRAYDEYLRGRFLWNKRQEQPVREAITHFQRAIEIDPTYALAYTDLSTCYSVLSNYAWTDSREAHRLGNASLQKAIALEADLDDVQVAWAQYLFVQLDFEQSRLHYERALRVNPSNVTAHHWLAYLHLALGDFNNALRENQEALRLEPLSLIINAYAGFIHYCMGEHEEALRALEKSVALEETFSAGHHMKAWVLAWMGQYDDALRAVNEGARGWGDHRQLIVVRAVTEARRKNREGAEHLLARLYEMEKAGRFIHPFEPACIFAALGEKEKMLHALDRAAEIRFYWWFTLLRVLPVFEPYRSDPRFQALLEKIGLD